MVLFDENNQLKKYSTVDAIIDNFCKVRLNFYIKRKAYQLKSLEQELCLLKNKERFIQEVVNEELIIMNRKEVLITDDLAKKGYIKDAQKGDYDYLLRMHIRTITQEKIDQINSERKAVELKLEALQSKKPEEIWVEELNDFEKHYTKWLQDMDKRVTKNKKGK